MYLLAASRYLLTYLVTYRTLNYLLTYLGLKRRIQSVLLRGARLGCRCLLPKLREDLRFRLG